MKKSLYVCILAAVSLGCTKSKNKSTGTTVTYLSSGMVVNLNGVSATNGCITCKTTYTVHGVDPGWAPSDTTLCNVSDSLLTDYLTHTNNTFNSPGNGTEVITTACKN